MVGLPGAEKERGKSMNMKMKSGRGKNQRHEAFPNFVPAYFVF